jgi:hypothetical protein
MYTNLRDNVCVLKKPLYSTLNLHGNLCALNVHDNICTLNLQNICILSCMITSMH